jgi:hypothetical protein
MVRRGCSWSTIEAEIAKCEVRCANCHRIKTSSTDDRIASWRHFIDILEYRLHSDPDRSLEAMRKAQTVIENQKKLYTYLSKRSCIDCGFSDIRVLEFDHIRGHKSNDVSRLLTSGATWERILSEIAKCDVRCANCHRIKTNERGGWWRNAPDH